MAVEVERGAGQSLPPDFSPNCSPSVEFRAPGQKTHPSRRRTEVFKGGMKPQAFEKTKKTTREIGKISCHDNPSKGVKDTITIFSLILFGFTYNQFYLIGQLSIPP